MRCPPPLLALPLAALLASLAPEVSSGAGPPLARTPAPERRRRQFLGVDGEAERVVGEAVLGGVLEGVARGGWLRLFDGVRSALDGVAGGVLSRVDEARSALEGVAKGVQATVDGAVHDAGEVVSSVLLAASPSIFPGTNWCGIGNRARGYEDTGFFVTADSCCRAHDSCPESIEAGGSKHGLKNDSPFTLSHCECDREFDRCLRDSNSLVARNIGVMFFNILRIQCFTYDYPLTCDKRSVSNTCEQYQAESRKSKIWQWVDNPAF